MSAGAAAGGPRPVPTSRPARFGVQITGSGSAIPATRVTNTDLEKLMETTDEWITQRTGIRSRYIHKSELGENTASFATEAARRAISDAGLAGADIDMVIVGTMTPDTPTPSASCTVASRIGTPNSGALDVNGACCGFVFCMNLAHDLIRGGSYRNILVVGADCITRHVELSTWGRATGVLFGDGAGAVVVRRTDDPAKGLLAQEMHSDGQGSKYLYIPTDSSGFAPGDEIDERKLGRVQMNGGAVFKFAVSTFSKLIEQTLERAGLKADDVDHYVCHQSNARILEAARERFGLPPEKLHVNIDRYGNTVAASVPLVFDEIRKAGRVKEGDRVMFLAFGAGLTWGSSLWQL